MNSGQSQVGAILTDDSPSMFDLSQALSPRTCCWRRWKECLRIRAHTAELRVRGTGCAVEPVLLTGGQEEAAAWRKWSKEVTDPGRPQGANGSLETLPEPGIPESGTFLTESLRLEDAGPLGWSLSTKGSGPACPAPVHTCSTHLQHTPAAAGSSFPFGKQSAQSLLPITPLPFLPGPCS